MSSKQLEIIEALKVRPEIDVEFEVRVSIDFMKAYLKKHPFLKSMVLGISGGQDSTLVGKLAQLAIDELNAEAGEDKYTFIAVSLPFGVQFDEEERQMALDFIQPTKRSDD